MRLGKLRLDGKGRHAAGDPPADQMGVDVKILAAVGLAVLGVGLVLFGVVWLIARAARTVYGDAEPEPQVPRYTYRYKQSDEALAVRTRERRRIAAGMYARARKVDAGKQEFDVSLLAKK